MNHSCFKSSKWYQAITLSERIASLQKALNTKPNVAENYELAQRRMQRWHSKLSSMTEDQFSQRLAMDGITEQEFLYILGEPVDFIHDRYQVPPDWLVELDRAFSRPTSFEVSQLQKELCPPEIVGFLNVIAPLIAQGCDRLHEEIQVLSQTSSQLPFDPNTVEEILFVNLPNQLLSMLNSTMVLELHVARLQGLLEGETAQERFQSFVQRLRQTDVALSILQEYPVLARQLTICINQWVDCSREFLHRLCTDWTAIRAKFSPDCDPGKLIEVKANLGDSHRGGHSVTIAKFSSGFQVVYKPRPLSVDVHFQELLSWLNHRGNHPSFRTLKIIERGTYGWVEFITVHSCTCVEEIQRFYQRQGGYLALLYMLEATDFHFENLIAEGEHPVWLDLEALFHPRIAEIQGKEPIKQAEYLASSTFYYSVLSIGLLPQRVWSNADSEGIDLSGLATVAGQLMPHGIPHWEKAGTDEMQFISKQATLSGGQNRPTLNGAEVDVLDYAEAIATGFTKVYQLLLQHRDELLSEDGPLAQFAEDTVRVIFRPTWTYGVLQRKSFHPDVLRDALERDCLFDLLWVNIEDSPHLAQFVKAEREDLHNGDIPIFTTRPDSTALWSSWGEQIADFFQEPSLNFVQRRVQQLSKEDLEKQLWFIRASLTTLAMGGDRVQQPTYQLTEPQTIANRERLLAAARSVGDRLEKLVLRGDEDATWIGLKITAKGKWSLAPLNMDLYNGLAGVTLFLAYLGEVTAEERYTNLAKAALTTIRHQVEKSQSYIPSIGVFDGWGGAIYTLAHLGSLWKQSELFTEAEEVVKLLPNLIEKDEQLDITGGAAGCISGLLSLYQCVPSEDTLNAAIQCGDRLVNRAQTMDKGVGWNTLISAINPLTGFSHGAAGIAWTLLELASLTGKRHFQTTAMAAMEYERSLFCPEVGNWPDLRDLTDQVLKGKDKQHICMMAWCHGAPGIGLARLRCLPYLDDAKIRSEINTALKTTLAHGFGGNHSLCHGDLGNLELLLQASLTLNEPQWKTQVDRLSAIILESINQHGWLCGVPLGVETPGLMTGLAGIGYELLRLAEPKRVPSVLVLEPPQPNIVSDFGQKTIDKGR
ncbi:MAG: type 2 lanthipeptide synthetase LanM family protein [Coleofasciculaceae cyanobacterium]